jgi:hypothetical protein
LGELDAPSFGGGLVEAGGGLVVTGGVVVPLVAGGGPSSPGDVGGGSTAPAPASTSTEGSPPAPGLGREDVAPPVDVLPASTPTSESSMHLFVERSHV